MSSFIKSISIRVVLENGVGQHPDLYNTFQQTFQSLPGVQTATYSTSFEWIIEVKYGTYVSYLPEEYLRIIDDSRKVIEELNKNYTNNKTLYDDL